MSLPHFAPESFPPPATQSEIRAAYGASFIERGQSASVVRKAIDKRGLRNFAAGVACVVLLAGAALTQVWMRTKVTQEGYRLARLTNEHAQLLRERERQTLAVGQLSAPARLEELAKTKLAMGPPPSDRTVVLVRTAPVEDGPRQAVALGDRKKRR